MFTFIMSLDVTPDIYDCVLTKKYSKTVATTIIPANTQKVTAAPNCSFIDGNVLVTRNTKNQFSITANPEAMAFVSVIGRQLMLLLLPSLPEILRINKITTSHIGDSGIQKKAAIKITSTSPQRIPKTV
ncbi:Protein of unknown function [Cotesia congregata]|uniref:Uncharacterized protein n=1 Tax=Cotesia congregata TaxID=51543 RepID=A0A8J2E3Y7_COTCN|nr:Protein of unknown function [Cotesia congregata]